MSHRKISPRIFGPLGSLIVGYPWWIVCVFLALAAASSIYAALRLELKTDQNDLVSADLPYNQRFQKYLEEFGDLEFLFVVIQVEKNPQRAMEVADAVAAELSKLDEHVESFLHRVPASSFGDSALLLAPKESVDGIAESIENNAAALRAVAGADGFAPLLASFSDLLDPKRASKTPSGGSEAAERGFMAIDAVLESLVEAAGGANPPPIDKRLEDGVAGEILDPRRSGYLFSRNLELAFVQIMPKKNFETLEVIEKPLGEIRAALDRVRLKFPGAKLGLTGRPVLAADEMKTTNEDMTYSTILAFVGVLVLFVVFFKRLRRPLLAGLTLGIAIAITFGLVTLTLGYLTLLSVVFAVMLVGLGVDFGVILLARYQEELLETDDIDGSIRRTLLSTGPGIWTGALTTGCSFYSSIFVDFKGLQELGFVAGTGLLVCLLCMIVLLPALIRITDHNIRRRRILHPPHPLTVPALGHAARHPRLTLAIFGLLTATGFWGFKGIPYDANLLELQAMGLESVNYERIIEEKSDASTWQAVFVVDGMDAVDRILAALKPAREAGIVGVVESVRDFVPADQSEKIDRLKPARELLASLRFAAATGPGTNGSSGAFDASLLRESLAGLLDRLGRLQSLAASRGSKEDAEAIRALDGLIERVEKLDRILEERPAEAARALSSYQIRFWKELEGLRGRLERLLRPSPITPASLRPELRRRIVSRDGARFLIVAYPEKDIWPQRNMTEFVEAVRKVDPEVTGVTIQVYESAARMHEGFLRAALYSLIMVFGFVLIDLRSLKLVGLTMVPVLIGVLWLLQLMPPLRMSFNLANFFALPIIIGCGVDAGVHIMHRFRETGCTTDVGLTTGSAVLLANLSNMIGFASMGIASHRGLASLGLLSALGCLTVLVASIILLPCLIELIAKGKKTEDVRNP